MAGKVWLLISIMFVLSFLAVYSTKTPNFKLVSRSRCICPGSIVTFECTVVGGLGTLWRGSALNCNKSELFLLHNRFSEDYTKTCNNEEIVGRSISEIQVENNSNIFTSQLNVTATPDIIGKNIECAHESTTVTVIGSYSISAAPLSSPDNVHISNIDVGLRKLTFEWSPVAPDCPAVHYNILASNCGSCPTTTNHTTVTCTDISTGTDMLCSFAVQTVKCGNIVGNTSDSISVDITETTMRVLKTHPNKVAQLMLIVGTAFLVLSGVIMIITVSIIITYCCLNSKARYRSRLESTDNGNSNITTVIVTSENENKDVYEYSQLVETPLDLKSLLQKLQGKVSKQWYQFGLSLGIPMDVMEEFNHYTEKDCLVEVLDYWLKNHPGKPTWQEITDAQRKIERFNTCQDKGASREVLESTVDIPPPKPPRCSSSVTAIRSMVPCVPAATTTLRNECDHEYECID